MWKKAERLALVAHKKHTLTTVVHVTVKRRRQCLCKILWYVVSLTTPSSLTPLAQWSQLTAAFTTAPQSAKLPYPLQSLPHSSSPHPCPRRPGVLSTALFLHPTPTCDFTATTASAQGQAPTTPCEQPPPPSVGICAGRSAALAKPHCWVHVMVPTCSIRHDSWLRLRLWFGFWLLFSWCLGLALGCIKHYVSC